MIYDSLTRHRRTIRLKDYDYSACGLYFITICTQDRESLFGEILVGADLVSAQIALNGAGRMVERIYNDTVLSYHDVVSDKHVIMPNHFHCIILIHGTVGEYERDRADTRSAPTRVYDVIREFKSRTTVEYVSNVKSGLFPTFNKRIWQRNYYERIIRNEDEYKRIWHYIDNNPANWQDDMYFTDAKPQEAVTP